MTDAPEQTAVKHPAKFTDSILEAVAALDYLPGGDWIDPFAGTGKIHLMRDLAAWTTWGVELEPEWADLHPGTEVGNALHLRWEDDTFDGAFTSPCYGNRMADTNGAKDEEKRAERTEHTYRHYLGRPLSADSSAAMQYGKAYRDFHDAAWRELIRVVKPSTPDEPHYIVVNVKNHFRDDREQQVVEYHMGALTWLRCYVHHVFPVVCPGQRHGANREKRVENEYVIVVRTPPAEQQGRLL